jgi:hypothetical protein
MDLIRCAVFTEAMTAGRMARSERSTRTRGAILSAAEVLFAERGMYAVSNRQISEAPFAPPPEALEVNNTKQLSGVQIWDGSAPWLIHGHDAMRALFTDSRASVDHLHLQALSGRLG